MLHEPDHLSTSTVSVHLLSVRTEQEDAELMQPLQLLLHKPLILISSFPSTSAAPLCGISCLQLPPFS